MKRRMPVSGWVWLAFGAIYFLVPLAATAEFSLNEGDGYGFSSYKEIFDDPQFRDTLWLSFRLAVYTVLISLIIFVPAVYLVNLRFPRTRRIVEFLSILPFVVSPIVLIVGLLYIYKASWLPASYVESPNYLVPGYVVLSFPFMFRALDAAFRSIDIHTLTEASQSLGAGWGTTLRRVILPNIRAGALSGSFLTLALVMGEFTMANIALFFTFPVYINYIGQTKANPAAALTIISFGITWFAMVGILLLGRRPGRGAVSVGGAR
ncbi:MAG TPA: ABC transporter permease subunit [Gaiellaceae bacterium]|jgi:putative spermidine/putrescine transport system permease protein